MSIVPPAILTFTNIAEIINLNDEIVNQCITLRKKHKMKLPDAMIAATAIVNHLTLVTRNVRDFSQMKGLKVLNPYD